VPDHPTLSVDALLNHALALHRAGRRDEAASLYLQVTARDPGNAAAWPLLGMSQQASGDLAAAAKSFGKAVALNPTDPRLRLQLIELLLRQGRMRQAIDAAREARAVAPRNLDVRFALVRALLAGDMKAEAVEANRAALALAHDSLPRLDQLATATRHALALDPSFAEAWRTLSMMVKRDTHDEEMAIMERLFADPATSDVQRTQLGFALGRGFDDLGRWDEAFRYFAEGNRLKRAAIDFSIEDRLAEMANIEHLFEGLPPLPAIRPGSQAPIFVVGLPRSGKTTIEHVLSRHPEIVAAGELEALESVVSAFITDHGLDRPQSTLAPIPAADWEQLGRAYLDKAGGEQAKLIVDTMPSNFRYVGFVRFALPGAKIIHTRRDPLEHDIALFQKFFASAVYDYTYDLTELGAYRARYRRLMELWRHAFPGFVLDIDVTDLATDPETGIRRLLEFCGLPWNPACLDLRNVEQRLGEPATFVTAASPLERLAPYSAHLAAVRT